MWNPMKNMTPPNNNRPQEDRSSGEEGRQLAQVQDPPLTVRLVAEPSPTDRRQHAKRDRKASFTQEPGEAEGQRPLNVCLAMAAVPARSVVMWLAHEPAELTV
jgi:hypothetical protein